MNAPEAPPMVLVADDEPTMLELVARHLRSVEPKLEVIEASDGDEAWRLASERLPDLVVLDVMMPGMSGWEVCRKIRQEAALAHTGVLMLTGIGESLNEATSPLFGADEYIDKPFDFERLDEKIASVLRARARQREAVPRPISDTASTLPVPGAERGSSRPVVRAKSKPRGATSTSVKRGQKKTKRRAQGQKGKQKLPAKKGKRTMAAKKAKKAKKTVKKVAKKKVAKKKGKKK
ncbi:MAG: response regulator transcription factor [Polyangiaceae bacterium]